MSLSSEDVVTNILTGKEILKRLDAPNGIENSKYSSNPVEYDLSLYIKTRKHKPEIGRFGSRYIFVK